MSQRRTAPSRLPEGGGLGPDHLSLESEINNSFLAGSRRWVPCALSTITMCLVGTVYGWTNTSFLLLTSGIDDTPLKLTRDEYSWGISLTVFGSMIGSLLTAQLADRIGRKYCLLACSIMFTLGWYHMYSATTVPMVYPARLFLGIGVGIARTINPMFVSEVTDIKFRGPVGVLIAANVNSGTLLSYALAIWLTYKSQLVLLVVISIIFILPLMCLRETPYFLVAKGQKDQACKSIAYYKGIEDPDKVKVELRALRAEARYGLHQQSRSDLLSQSESDLPATCSSTLSSLSSSNLPSPYISSLSPPSNSDLPPPYSSNLPSPSSSDLPPPYSSNLHLPSSSDLPPPYSSNLPSQSTSDLPPPYRSNLPSQSIHETHSDPRREGVGTEATSDLDLPSSSDSHSQSTSSVHSKFTCEVYTQTTGELRVEYSRISPGLPLQTSRELHSQSASDLHRPSTSQIHRSSTSEIQRPSTSEVHRSAASEIHRPSTSQIHRSSRSEIHRSSTSEIQRPSTSEVHRSAASEIHRPSTSQIHRSSTSEIHRSSTSEIQRPSTSEVHRPAASEIHRSSTSEIHRSSTSEIHRPSASEIHRSSTSEIQRPSTSEVHRPAASEILRPSTSQILPQTTSELHSRSRSDLRTQSSVDSRASTRIPEPYMDGTKYTCLNKLRAILQRSNRKALFIMLGLIMAQQLSGNFNITQYLEVMIRRKTTFIDLYKAMILVQLARLISGYLTTLMVEWYGRRTLLILSTLGSCLTLFISAGLHFFAENKFHHSILSFLLSFDLIIYQLLFQIGLGTLPYILLCDLFPTKLKGFVGAIVVIFDGIISFTASKLNQVITDNLERDAIFFIFATSCIFVFLLVFIWVPETKGKTYHEIEALLGGENLNSLNEEVRSDEMDIHRI